MKKNAIIFLPGYKGSMLKNKHTGEIVWLKANQLFKKNSLERDYNNEDILISSGIFRNLKLLFFSLDIYDSFLNRIETHYNNNYDTICFDYDWREDVVKIVNRLYNQINKIKDKYDTINFITHSLGGYILTYYLLYGNQEPDEINDKYDIPNNIKDIIILTAPFKGSNNFFKELHYSEILLWNKSIISKEIIRSFPSVYQALPYHDNAVIDINNKSIDIFNINTWEKYELSYFNKHSNYQFIAEYKDFLIFNLKRAKKIFELINNSRYVLTEDIRIHNIIATGYDSLNSLIVNSQNKVICTKKEYKKYRTSSKLYSDGDGVVLTDSAIAPHCLKNNNFKELFIKSPHNDIVKNKECINYIFKNIQ